MSYYELDILSVFQYLIMVIHEKLLRSLTRIHVNRFEALSPYVIVLHISKSTTHHNMITFCNLLDSLFCNCNPFLYVHWSFILLIFFERVVYTLRTCLSIEIGKLADRVISFFYKVKSINDVDMNDSNS